MATVNDILIRVRRKLGDMQKLKVSDEELIIALNEAIDALSGKLSIDNEAELIKTITLENTTPVIRPNDFIRFVGQYPVQFGVDTSGNVTLQHLDNTFSGTLNVRYFAVKSKILTLNDTIPFTRTSHQTELVDSTAAAFKQDEESPKAKG